MSHQPGDGDGDVDNGDVDGGVGNGDDDGDGNDHNDCYLGPPDTDILPRLPTPLV